MIQIKKGLDLPLTGRAQNCDVEVHRGKFVGVLASDYPGLKPTMHVEVGQQVRKGDVLFEDKKNPGVLYTAPQAGKVHAIHRGEKRAFRSIVLQCEGQDEVSFPSLNKSEIQQASVQQLEERLLVSGLWTAFRTRPYSKVPAPTTRPHSIFVSLMDTHPLAADPMWVLNEYKQDFEAGLSVLSRFSSVHIVVDKAVELKLAIPEQAQVHYFSGPHPAGLVGTHIHFIDPVHRSKSVWTIAYQDVIAYGKLFLTGRIWGERIVSLTGAAMLSATRVLAPLGSCVSELLSERTQSSPFRAVSGSVLGGKTAIGVVDFLGRYHTQVTTVAEAGEPEMLPYLRLGPQRHSVLASFLAKWIKPSRYDFDTSTRGELRAMVPLGSYEAVMPLDILPTQLLRALIVGDLEMAEQLGCLELDEEDLALCSYVCVGKYEYGPILRDVLNRIEKEG